MLAALEAFRVEYGIVGRLVRIVGDGRRLCGVAKLAGGGSGFTGVMTTLAEEEEEGSISYDVRGVVRVMLGIDILAGEDGHGVTEESRAVAADTEGDVLPVVTAVV